MNANFHWKRKVVKKKKKAIGSLQEFCTKNQRTDSARVKEITRRAKDWRHYWFGSEHEVAGGLRKVIQREIELHKRNKENAECGEAKKQNQCCGCSKSTDKIMKKAHVMDLQHSTNAL